MNIVKVKNLSKEFKLKQKLPGFKGGLKSLFKPRYINSMAVNDISFNVEKGEKIAFIGPNGAGKSTTIKMLTGILHPTKGTGKVINLNPWKQRKKLAFKIGTVFGQKTQLWYHLPAIDTFYLFSKIYELDKEEFKKRRDYLIDKFQVKEFVNQPVRKLSLGQRMRCEMIASLLHKPEILFLDEPTIGLDIVAKQQLRDILNDMNKKEQTTIFLTSHDAGDIEHIADRVIVIDKGKIIFNDSVEVLKNKYIDYKIIELKLIKEKSNGEIINIEGIKILKKNNYLIKLKVDINKTSVKNVIDKLFDQYNIEDITINEPPMDEIITKIYEESNKHN